LEFASDRGGSVLCALAIRPLLLISSLAGAGDRPSPENHSKKSDFLVQKKFQKSEKKACQVSGSSINEGKLRTNQLIFRSKKISKK
jgi:hypothetical protein